MNRDDSVAVESAPDPAQERHKRRVFAAFSVMLLLGCAALFALWFFSWRHYESTDDAFIDGHIASVSAQVSGRVEKILVKDNQHVRAGDVILQIDPRDAQNALDQALAELAVVATQTAQVEAQIVALKANWKQADANVRLGHSDYRRDQEDYKRYADSYPAVSQSSVSLKRAAAEVSAANLEARQQAAEYSRAQYLKEQASLLENRAELDKASVRVANARLQLSYTQVVAPQDGHVTRRSVEQGNYVSVGSTLLSVVSDEVWVTANFKELQLATMKAGQAVQVRVDAYPQQRFNARVDSFQRGTGAVFSLLPAENATGNFVKIVQRVPVKIVFTDPRIADYPLAPGMSVVPDVHVR